ncbi:MAG: enoyl-CoA hydratase/isomerase family protein, partial [Candidatus Helarchaeota archaeon]
MTFEHIIYEEKDRIAWLTLNRPEKMNALSMRLSDEFVEAIERVRSSTELQFFVIRGAGDNFCVGDDITEMIKWGNANDITRRARYYQNMANQLEELDKITIAAVDGYAVGG